MEHLQPQQPPYIEMVNKLNQAIFYCYNESSERLPVGMVSNFSFKDNNTLCFGVSYFPPTEQIWNVFAAELHFYKKAIPFSVVLHGVAIIGNTENNLVQFSIQNADYFGFEDDTADIDFLSSLVKPYIYFYRKSSELLSHSFIKKGITNTLSKLSAHA